VQNLCVQHLKMGSKQQVLFPAALSGADKKVPPQVPNKASYASHVKNITQVHGGSQSKGNRNTNDQKKSKAQQQPGFQSHTESSKGKAVIKEEEVDPNVREVLETPTLPPVYVEGEVTYSSDENKEDRDSKVRRPNLGERESSIDSYADDLKQHQALSYSFMDMDELKTFVREEVVTVMEDEREEIAAARRVATKGDKIYGEYLKIRKPVVVTPPKRQERKRW